MLKYRLVGTNLKTAARMVIEVEAQNRVAAERAASHAGMEVLHIEQVPDDPLGMATPQPRSSHRGELPQPSRAGKWITIAAIVTLLAAGIAYWIIVA